MGFIYTEFFHERTFIYLFINLLFGSRLFHNTIRNINGVLWHCSIFILSIQRECFKICNLKDSNKLVVSEIFKIIGLLLLLYQNQYLILVVAQILLGLSYSMMTGVDTAIIKRNITNEKYVQNKSNSYMFLSLLISGIIGSYLLWNKY